MSAGEPFLGALDGSGCVFGKERAETAPGTAYCTQKSLKFQDRTKHSLWLLAGVQAAAFNGANRNAKTKQFHLRTAMLLALTVYDRRAHPSGQAVCLLGLRKGRFILLVAGLVLLIATAGLLSPYAGSALAALVLAILMPVVVGAFRARAANNQLKRLTPSGRYVYVHSLASTLPGAGAALLHELIREKDENGCSLALDASNEKLVTYYAKFGFVAQGDAVRMPDGSRHTRMWRPANTQEGTLNGRR
jgi:hypothetical protein